MSKILSVETSSANCSVAFHQEGNCIGTISISREQSHSKQLNTLLEMLLDLVEIKFSNLDAISVSMGPGSYTGLRIGIATVKGLCYALNLPLIAINTLEIMAYNIQHFQKKHFIAPMLDARRMEVYTAIYDSTLQIVEPTQSVVLSELTFQELVENNKIIFCGDGSSKFKNIINNSNAYFIDEIYPDAKWMGIPSYLKYKNQDFVNLSNFEPFYLKNFRSNYKL